MRTPRGVKVWMAAMALLMVVGCDARATQDGVQGDLRFVMDPADGSRDFDRPLAVGSTVILTVESAGERRLDRVRDVSVSPSNLATARVVQGSDDQIALIGQQPGAIDVTVTVDGAGEVYSDTVRMTVEYVDRVEIRHQCVDGPEAAYLVDRPVFLELDRLDRRGTQVVGYSDKGTDPLRGCQVVVDPQGLSQDVHCDEAHLSLPGLRDPISVYVDVIPEVSTNTPEVDVHFIFPWELDFEPNMQDLRVGVTSRVELFPVSYNEGWPVCTHLDLYVYIDSPSTCSGPNGELEFAVPATERNEIQLRGQRYGICEFAVFVGDEEFLFDAYVD